MAVAFGRGFLLQSCSPSSFICKPINKPSKEHKPNSLNPKTMSVAAARSKPEATTASAPFRLPRQNPFCQRIFRSPVELSCCVETMFPFHTATSSALLISMLSVSRRSYGWTAEGTTRRTVVRAQQRPTWLPGLDPPPYLVGTLDFGFDPLGLGENPESLRWYVQAELVHARFAMAGIAGILFTRCNPNKSN